MASPPSTPSPLGAKFDAAFAEFDDDASVPFSSFTPASAATPSEIVSGKVNSAIDPSDPFAIFEDREGASPLGATAPAAATEARNAFLAATGLLPVETAHSAALALKAPEAVRHIVALLTNYDWAFVEQAKELRGYVVASLMEETCNPKPEVRLKALKLLGDVTEVGLFTQRVEVTSKSMSEDEIEKKLAERLAKLTVVSQVEDAQFVADDEGK